MEHLSRDELLLAAEALARDRPREGSNARHVDACDACREQVVSLARSLEEVLDAELPEPSPLFWDQFSRRVSAAVRAGTRDGASAGAGGPWRRQWHLAWPEWRVVAPLAGLAGAVALAVVVATGRTPRVETPAPAALAGTSEPPAVEAPVLAESADDEAWAAFSTLAAEVDAADEGLSVPPPGAAEGAVLQLSDEERAELIRLLRAEIENLGTQVEG